MEQQNQGQGGEVDMFGHPVLPLRDRRGRKSYRKDAENQRYVADLAADGWTHEAIAEVMGCDPKTLRKHFSRELNSGRLMATAELLSILHKKAREGHTPSIRLLLERMANPAPTAARRGARPEAGDGEADTDQDGDEVLAPAARARGLGKKAQRDAAAQEMPDLYGDIFNRLRRH